MINHYGRGVRLTRVCKCAEGGGLRGELAGRARLHAQHQPLAGRLFGSVLYKNKSLQAFTRACTARNWQGQASGAHVWRDRILNREFCAFIRAAFVQMQLLSLQCGGCSDGNDWRRGVAGEACLSHQGRCCWKTQRFSSEVKHTCATASAPSIGEWGIAEPVCCRRSSPGKGGCAPGLVSLGLSCAFRVWLSTIQFLICQDRGHG